MDEYMVTVRVVGVEQYAVEADSPQEAKQKWVEEGGKRLSSVIKSVDVELVEEYRD